MFAEHHKKAWSPAFFKVSVYHLFDILESRKRNCCLGKKSGKANQDKHVIAQGKLNFFELVQSLNWMPWLLCLI